jgi:exodeoxyribonuclease VII small subunit
MEEKTLDSYEVMYTELETIIETLQSGSLSLDEAVSSYERSTQLIKKLEKHLKEAQNKITKIKANLK